MNEQEKTTKTFNAETQRDYDYSIGYYLFSKRKDKEAAHLIENAAKNGHVQAQAHIGSMYLQGLGVGRDFKKALAYLNQAAEKNDPRALGDLGVLYANGDGVEQDLSTAADYFMRSLEKGGGRHVKEQLKELRKLLQENPGENPAGNPQDAQKLLARIDASLSSSRARIYEGQQLNA